MKNFGMALFAISIVGGTFSLAGFFVICVVKGFLPGLFAPAALFFCAVAYFVDKNL